MKTLITNIIIITFIFSLIIYPEVQAQTMLQQLDRNPSAKFEDWRKAYEDIWKDVPIEKRRGWKQFKRWEWFWEGRIKPDGTFPAASDLVTTIKSFQKRDDKKSDAIKANIPTWTSLGPDNNPTNINGGIDVGVGRMNVVRFNPVNTKIVWAGSAGGGVWRSLNGGKNWDTFPFTQFMSLGVSDIAIPISNPDVVYVATGDADGIGGGGGNSFSIGVIKTTDKGDSWQITNLSYNFSNQQLVSRLLVHPQNPNLVFAATSQGIYKTTDGGDTWVRKTDNTYFKDMEFKPDNPDIIYAATSGGSGTCSIYKTTDGGESWKMVHSVSGVSRIALNVTSANPSNIYALCAAQNSSFHSFRKSADNGETWQIIYSAGMGVNLLGRDQGIGSDKNVGQGWYDLCFAVAPNDENEIYVGGINIWKSTNGGVSWNLNTHWVGSYGVPCVHADIHDLAYDELHSIIYSASDGGIDCSSDGGNKWSNLNNGMNTTQYYKIACSAKDANVIYGGAQDNGSHRYNNGDWARVYGGDGMNCEVDWEKPLTAYVSLYNGYLYKTINGVSFSGMFSPDQTGENGAWVTPFIISPINHNVLYAGYRNVWKTTNSGSNWTRLASLNNNTTLRSLAAAPSDSNTLYAATTNSFWVTYNGGASWQRITDVPDNIGSIAVDPKNAQHFWLTNKGFNAGNKVFEYNGTTKNNITGNLPNIPVNSIVYQKDSPDRLYIGTDIGVYYSDYNSANWEIYGQELPNVIVNDLEIHYGTKKLRAATYGRGVWETSINTCNITEPQVQVTGITSFCSGDSVIIEALGNFKKLYWSNGETTKKIVAKESGSYSVIVEDDNGCKARSKAVMVDVRKTPNVLIKPIGKYPVCEGDSINIELNVSMGFIKYQWSNGDTVRKTKVFSPGKYIITVTTADSCMASSSIDIIVYPKPAKPQIIRWSYNYLRTFEAESYQWFLNGKPIKGATDYNIKMDSLGDYTVQISDRNGCTSLSDVYNVVSDVNDLHEGNTYAAVFPNPTNGSFTISLKTLKPDNYRIFVKNLLGMTVAESASFIDGEWTKEFKLDIFPSGVYNIIITNSSESIVLKIVKN